MPNSLNSESMPNVRASSGMIGTTAGPNSFVAGQSAQQPGERHRGRHRLLARAGRELVERLVARAASSGRRIADLACGQRDRRARSAAPAGSRSRARPRAGGSTAASSPSASASSGISSCRYSRSRSTRSCGVGHLLDLVRGVAGLDVGAERPALDRLGQDHRRRARLLGGGLVGGVELAVVVPAAGEPAQLLVGEVLDHLAQPRVGAEEVVADVGAGLDRVALELAVDRGVHLVEQHAVDVLGEQLVPLRAPDDLDDVPAGTRGRPPRAPG